LFCFIKINNTTLNTKDSLYETYFDVRLNMGCIKHFTFALVLYGNFFVIYCLFAKPGMQIQSLSNTVLITTFIIFLSYFVFWFNGRVGSAFYGKYAKEIKKVIDELKKNNKKPILDGFYFVSKSNLL
jgi:hypothetical protein